MYLNDLLKAMWTELQCFHMRLSVNIVTLLTPGASQLIFVTYLAKTKSSLGFKMKAIIQFQGHRNENRSKAMSDS